MIDYLLHLGIMIGIYMVLTASLNLTYGYGGMLNFGHIAFYAIGAYTSALLASLLGLPFWMSILLAGMLAALFGLLVSAPTLRLKGDYLALGTLGFSIIIEAMLNNWTSLTKGPLGIPGIPKPVFFGFPLQTTLSYSILVILFVAISLFIIRTIMHSPYGRVLEAIRDDEIAAKTLGKDVFMAKMKALIISAFFAGCAGAIYAHYITYIDPAAFSIMETILVFSMLLVGGTAGIIGPLVGAIILTILPEPLRFLPLPGTIIGGIRQGVYAFLLIVIIRLRPDGLIKRWKQ